jgi:hypothetical protein
MNAYKNKQQVNKSSQPTLASLPHWGLCAANQSKSRLQNFALLSFARPISSAKFANAFSRAHAGHCFN